MTLTTDSREQTVGHAAGASRRRRASVANQRHRSAYFDIRFAILWRQHVDTRHQRRISLVHRRIPSAPVPGIRMRIQCQIVVQFWYQTFRRSTGTIGFSADTIQTWPKSTFQRSSKFETWFIQRLLCPYIQPSDSDCCTRRHSVHMNLPFAIVWVNTQTIPPACRGLVRSSDQQRSGCRRVDGVPDEHPPFGRLRQMPDMTRYQLLPSD